MALAAVLIAPGAASAAARPAASAAACGRACLQGFVDRYLDALVAHDPGRLPLVKGARFTENGQTLALGDGLWGTIEAREGYSLYFADPQAGEVGAYVTVRESGKHQILGLRLKVAGGRIAEIETLVVRPKAGYVFGAPEALKDKPIFHEALTPSQRRPRAEMVRIANSYFEGLTHATETLTPFDKDCQRIENGVVTANNPEVPPGGMAMWKKGCHEQFATHFSQFITPHPRAAVPGGRRGAGAGLRRGLLRPRRPDEDPDPGRRHGLAGAAGHDRALHLPDRRAVQDPGRPDHAHRGAGDPRPLRLEVRVGRPGRRAGQVTMSSKGTSMKRMILAALAAAGVMLAGAQAQAAAAAPLPVPPVCDRACLEGMIDAYLQAMVAHDPSRLPLTADAKFTENGSELKLGDGLWGTIQSIGDYKLTFVDPATAEAGAFVTVQESGRRAILGLRLHVQSGVRINQVETIVSRTTPGAGAFGNGPATKRPMFFTDVPAGEQTDRAHMMAITDSYFEGLQEVTEKLTPFAPDCQRRENFTVTAGNPDAPPGMTHMTCGEQFATHFSKFFTQIRERRYPIMDTQKGLGMAIVFFDHAGVVKDVQMTDGTTMHVPPPFDAPYAFYIFELFKIQDGPDQGRRGRPDHRPLRHEVGVVSPGAGPLEFPSPWRGEGQGRGSRPLRIAEEEK
ncbi:MAG: hypothetical protein WDM92_16335 [Caulobacteraceae bacterium]